MNQSVNQSDKCIYIYTYVIHISTGRFIFYGFIMGLSREKDVFPHIFVWGSCFWFCIPSASSRSRPAPVASSHTTCSHTTYLQTQLTHTQLAHTHNLPTHNLHTHTHNLLTHTTYSHTTYSHTHNLLTHNLLTHN